MEDPGCVFCDLAAGRRERSVAFEDEACTVLMDSRPVTPGHSLVIPRRHAAHLADLDDQTWTHVCAVAKRVELALRQSGVRCEGSNLFLADGEAASQSVPHVHLHVMPRFVGDAFRIDADWTARPSRENLDQVAARLRDSYRRLWRD
ncbi:HIT family protein [Candidatus Nephthysia bennettiae]|uniref:HIT family protein n=1 Tax=Candidatus Nephthysia bennettiae TaxID=3127016 RepID=A0A934K5U2_9BACT|nr:HIT family protein [Candidatus Dormibacteraeota bacterium]MBJ7611834.1 HIT family protein [Candidatus Dormibacteraeota bacterium]